jgi:hypothetical protein
MRGASFARIVAGAREMSGHATCEVMAVRVRRYMALAPTPTSKVDMSNHKTHDARTPDRLGMYGAAIATIGVVASGPVALVTVAAIDPQPPWIDAWLFAAHFHSIQLLPYACGFLLGLGVATLVTSIRAQMSWEERATSALAQTSLTVFATLASFNYIAQIAFVPALARDYLHADASLLAAFTMVHPGSLAWALEMWSYAFLGIATFLVAPFFSGGRVERAARWMFRSNGIVSLAGAVWTAVRPGWELGRAGMVAFACWNVLALAMAMSAWIVFRMRLRGYVRVNSSHRELRIDWVPLP